MADMDPELAFLSAQKEYDPAGDYSIHDPNQPVEDDADDDDEEEYDPASAYASYSGPFPEQSPSEQSASMPESATNTPPAVDDSLKPQPAPASTSITPMPSKQPRTMGGFVVESEDEDDVPESNPVTAGSASAAGGLASSPQRSHTNTPTISHTPQLQNVPVHSAQAQGHSGASSSSSVAVNDTALNSASAVPNGSNQAPDATKTVLQQLRSTTTSVTPAPASILKSRLPQDRVGQFEDRIAEDPRGDIEAWLSLIDEYRRRHKIDDTRAVFDRFFQVFPSAADQWIEYINLEQQQQENNQKVEILFNRSIAANPHVGLWTTYVNYARRVHNVTVDETKRAVIHQVYEFVLEAVGIDIAAGKLWLDYIEFIKSGPGMLGGQGWQDMQKMDMLRKIYQRAVAVPTNATLEIWRDYDKFEMSFNKATGRRNMQENSQLYMNARSANNVLDSLTKGINRTTIPKLPPAKGFDGHDEYTNQVKLWSAWIEWEKKDPIYIKENNRALYNKRVLYLYKQAAMSLRFWPQLWFEAAEWCFENDLKDEGDSFLSQGMEANPESCLLAFRKAHQIELHGDFPEGEAGSVRRGDAVREPFNKVLDALYELTNKTKQWEESALGRIKETHAAQQAAEDLARSHGTKDSDYDSDDDDAEREAKLERRRKAKEDVLQAQLQGLSSGYNAQILILKRTLSHAWIALMRTMRRIQGKGRPDPPAGVGPGFRGIFAEARKKGKLLSDAYVASALIEHHCYQDPAATKIFDRGMKLFPDDEHFALEYIKHLVKQNDGTNARSVFEIVVNRLSQKPGGNARSKPLFAYLHKYESQYGELAQIVKLEKRMRDLFPEDPQLALFAQRFSPDSLPSPHKFDPTSVLAIVSWKAQMRPALLHVMQSVEEPMAPVPVPTIPQLQETQPTPVVHSPRVMEAMLPVSNSPKRPFDDLDGESAQPRKMMRGESPLKGAAGRRLDAARRNLNRASDGASNTPTISQPAPLPREINFLLSIMPGAQHYHATKFNPERIANLLRNTDMRLPAPPPVQMQAPIQTPTPVPQYAAPPPMNQWGPPPTGMSGYYGR